MTYAEFYKTYKWARENYPGVGNLPLGNEDQVIGKMTERRYHKSGSRWVLDCETEKRDFSTRYYLNCVDAVPFFRGLGGSERVEQAYTVLGYLPVKISSVSPDRKTRTVREFQIL